MWMSKVYVPGKRSLRLAGGLLVSMVSLCTAVLTGNTGLMISLKGRLALALVTRRPPMETNEKDNKITFPHFTLCSYFNVILSSSSIFTMLPENHFSILEGIYYCKTLKNLLCKL